MSNDVSIATAAILPFVLAAILVGVFVLWRPGPLRRLIDRHGGALRWAALIVAVALVVGRGIVAIR